MVKEIHATTLGRILRAQGFSFQRTKTWKESTDPDFAAKKNASARRFFRKLLKGQRQEPVFLVEYASGKGAEIYPEGTGKLLPANQKARVSYH